MTGADRPDGTPPAASVVGCTALLATRSRYRDRDLVVTIGGRWYAPALSAPLQGPATSARVVGGSGALRQTPATGAA